MSDIAFNDNGEAELCEGFRYPKEQEGVSEETIQRLLDFVSAKGLEVDRAEETLIRRILTGRLSAGAILSRFCAEAIRVGQMEVGEACRITENTPKAFEKILAKIPHSTERNASESSGSAII